MKCPYCEAEVTSRGLYQHIWRSGDDAHGGHKDVPDDWDDVEPELAGEQDITVHVPTEKKYDHDRSTCRFCGKSFKGTHGLSVHLSKADDDDHPDDATVDDAAIRSPEDFSEKESLNVSSQEDQEAGGGQEAPDGYVPLPDVIEAISRMEAHGKAEAAEELRRVIKPYR